MKIDKETEKAIYSYAHSRKWDLAPEMPFHLSYHSEEPGDSMRIYVRYYWDEPKLPRPDDSYVPLGKVVDEYTQNKLIKNKKNYYS